MTLDVSPGPVFTGDPVRLTVTSLLGYAPTSLLVASATIDFGDGTIGTAAGSCTNSASVDHVYEVAGDYKPNVTEVSACNAGVADLSGVTGAVRVFPTAPAASARWPACTTFELQLAAPRWGAGMGNVAVLITLRNVGAHGCTLKGYPGLILVGRNHKLLATHVTQATGGSYMFPGVAPHIVALAPGEVASFEIGYADNPSGPGVNEPYEVACPPSVAVRVILPNTTQFGTATVAMGACEGALDVSPIVPAAAGLQFP